MQRWLGPWRMPYRKPESGDLGLEVCETSERLGRVTRSLQAAHHVGRRDLARRRRVPHRAGADCQLVREAVGADAAIGHGRYLCGQVSYHLGRVARSGGVGQQLPAPHAQNQVPGGVVRDVGVHVINVTRAEHVEGATAHRRAAPGSGAGAAGAGAACAKEQPKRGDR
jgi:hypothetical protein